MSYNHPDYLPALEWRIRELARVDVPVFLEGECDYLPRSRWKHLVARSRTRA